MPATLFRRAARLLAALAVAVLAVLLLAYPYARHRLSQAEAAWGRDAEAMPAFAARFPTQPDSPGVLKLDELTRPLGIAMVPGPAGAAPLSKDDASRKLLIAFGRFVSERGRAASDAPASLPPEAAGFLEQEKARLDAIQEHILTQGPFAYALDMSKGMAAPVPSLLGQRFLQNVLLARAYVAAQDGRAADAERALEASFSLSASLADRPELITQLVNVAVANLQDGVLRSVRLAPEAWLPRLRGRTFGERLLATYQAEAAIWLRHGAQGVGIFDLDAMEDGAPGASSLMAVPGRLLTAPYVRLSFADTSDRLLAASRALREQKRCDFDIGRYEAEFTAAFPRWNVIGKIAMPSVLRTWTSARQADFDREITVRVLEARAERRASGRWPSASVPSAVCEGVAWIQEPAATGDAATLRPSAPPFRPGASAWDWHFAVGSST